MKRLERERRTTRGRTLSAVLLAAVLLLPGAALAGICEMSEQEVLDFLADANAQLASLGYDFAIEQIDCFMIGQGRPSVRVHQQPFRWVPNDQRRLAAGNDMTYIVDLSMAATGSGVGALAAEAAMDRAVATWQADSCLSKVALIKRADPGTDITVFDFLIGGPPYELGNPFEGDVVYAGFFPGGPPFFDVDNETVGFSVTAIFRDEFQNPTDVDGDNYLDTAFSEVYFNDALMWGIGAPPPAFDIETGALHESGHSLGIGHFGPPPDAVMNPVYSGLRQELFSIDHAGMCTVWEAWPSD